MKTIPTYKPLEAVIYAKAVLASLTAKVVAPPADKHLFLCVLKLREFLDRQFVDKIWWVDTLMMVSDGLTKGVIR